MSTEYTHFDKLAFNKLFAIGPDGSETLLINSSGAFVGGLTISGNLTVTKLFTGNGTKLLPSQSYTNLTNTGWYLASATLPAFSVGGVEMLRIDTSGNVNIGYDTTLNQTASTSSNEMNFHGQTFRCATSRTSAATIASKNYSTSSLGVAALEAKSVAGDAYVHLNKNDVNLYTIGVKVSDNGSLVFAEGAGLASSTVRAKNDGITKAWTFGTPTTSLTHGVIGQWNISGAGSASTCSLVIASAGLGIYRAGAKQMGFAAGSTNIATITTAALLVAKALTVTGAASASNLSGTNTGDNVNASTSTAGVVSTITQSFTGAKTFVTQLIGKGTAAADSAATGYIGEAITSGAIGPSNAPSSTHYGDLTSISLTAGDWDVCFNCEFVLNSATVTKMYIGISTTTGDSATGLTSGDNFFPGLPPNATSQSGASITGYRVSVAATTIVYAKMYAEFSVGTPQFRGRLSARRAR